MSFSVSILGSSSALPTSERNLTAHLLNVNERFFLIDCGEGTQLQLRKYKAKISRLDHIFITHLHGDHTFGLPGLISTFNLLGRKKTLNIYAHPDLEHIIFQFLSFFIVQLSYPIKFHPLIFNSPQLILENGKMTVHSFPLKHRIPTCGFIFKEKPPLRKIRKELIEFYKISPKDIPDIKKGADFITEEGKCIKNEILTFEPGPAKSYAFCSDTSYTEDIISQISNVDVLYHEATFAHEDQALAQATQHSTAVEAAQIAKLANAKKLILGHFSARYKDVTHLLDQACQIFPNTMVAEDGLKIII